MSEEEKTLERLLSKVSKGHWAYIALPLPSVLTKLDGHEFVLTNSEDYLSRDSNMTLMSLSKQTAENYLALSQKYRLLHQAAENARKELHSGYLRGSYSSSLQTAFSILEEILSHE